MSFVRHVGVIYRKDFVEALRDRRTLVAMVVIPVVLYPALMLVVMQALQFQKQKLEQERYRIAVPDTAHKAWLDAALAAESDSDASSSPASQAANRSGSLRARIRSGQFDVVVERQGADQDLAAYAKNCINELKYQALLALDPPPRRGETAAPNRTAAVWFDAAETGSNAAQGGLTRVLEHYSNSLVEARMARRGLPTALLEPLTIVPNSVASPQKLGGSLLGQIMPFLLVIITLSGAIYPAIDLTAGERERGTLETLMTAPVPILRIVAGKFLVILSITVIIALLNLISLGATIKYSGLADAIARSLPGGGVTSIPVAVLPIVLIAMLPLSVLFSAVMLAVCSFARTFKEAQNYMMPVMIGAMMPAMAVAYMPTVKLSGTLAVLPVANVVALIRELFLGKHDAAAIAMVMGSTSLYALTAVVIAAKLYGQEAVLFTDVGSYKTLLMRRFIRPAALPTAAASLLLIALIFPVQFYWQNSLVPTDGVLPLARLAERLRWVIASCQLLCYVLPVLCLTWYLRLSARATLSLRMPTPAAGFGALLIAAGIVPVMTWLGGLQHAWFPPSADAMKAEEGQLALITNGSTAVVILIFGLLPGVCEELLFRGFLLAGLRRKLRPLALCVAVGALFGMYHIQLDKIPTVTLLGILLAYVCWRSGSIFCAILIHAANNGLALAGAKFESLGQFLGQNSEQAGPALVLPTAWACVAAGIVLVAMSPGSRDNGLGGEGSKGFP